MKEDWTYKKLGEVCDIYQPKTLSTGMLVPDGKYLVYGANGVIGRYNEFNHKEKEILVTCRGATCGTLNVSEPKSWINGNAMVVHSNTSNLVFDFLKYALHNVDWSLVITGAAQPQITRQKLSPVVIPVPSLSEQEAIVRELDLLNDILSKKRAQLKEYDALQQSLFYTMFGDPVTNEKGWEVKKFDEFASATTGITYTPDDVSDQGIIVLRSSNIQENRLDFEDIVRVKKELKEKYIAKDGDILMCSRNGSFRLVGKTAIITGLQEEMTWGAFMTVIRSNSNPYLLQYFRTPAFREQLVTAKTTTVNQITIGMLNALSIPLPPLPLQQEFAKKVEAIEELKVKVNDSIRETENLLASRMDYYFG